MSSNILTLESAGQPMNCADGVKTASEHLNNSPVMGMEESSNTVSAEYTEAVVGLANRAKPEDCARCIGKFCMLKVDENKVRGDRLQATHSRIIEHDPRDTIKKAHQDLDDQSYYFEIKASEEEADLINLAEFHARRGVKEQEIADMGFHVVDPETLEDYKDSRNTLNTAA